MPNLEMNLPNLSADLFLFAAEIIPIGTDQITLSMVANSVNSTVRGLNNQPLNGVVRNTTNTAAQTARNIAGNIGGTMRNIGNNVVNNTNNTLGNNALNNNFNANRGLSNINNIPAVNSPAPITSPSPANNINR